MKKVILAAIAVFALGTNAQAQMDVKFGPKVGVNFSNITGGDGETEMLTGFHVGAVAEFKVNDQFSVQPELVYSAQGGKNTLTTEALGVKTTTSSTQNLGYLNIPIMLKYYVIDGLSLELGPQFGFLMNASSDFEIDSSIDSFDKKGSSDNKDAFNSFDAGLGFGIAYDLPAGFNAGLRYNLGLTKIGKDTTVAGQTVKAPDYKNSTIQLGVGYKF